MYNLLLYVFICAALSILYAVVLIIFSLRRKRSQGHVDEICQAIQRAGNTYLFRYYNVIALIGIVIFLALGFLAQDWFLALGFLAGALLSCLVAYLGLVFSVKMSSRVLAAAETSARHAYKLAAKASLVNGFFVIGAGLAVVTGFYCLYNFNFIDIEALIGLFFGIGLVALVIQVGGGIYAKACDRAAQLTSQVESGFDKKDPNNSSLIADDLGDIVSGSFAAPIGLLETYVLVLGSVVFLGMLYFKENMAAVIYPIVLSGAAVLATMLGTLFIRAVRERKDGQLKLSAALFRGFLVASALNVIAFYPISAWLMGDNALYPFWYLYLCTLVGLVAMLLMVIIALYYASTRYRPVKKIAQFSENGHAANIILGVSVSLGSVFWPVIVLVVSILIAYTMAGVYGLALAALGMLSVVGIIASMSSFSPIVDNAHDVAGMARMSTEMREKSINPLDMAGNTFKAVSRVYAIMAAGLTSLVLFSLYVQQIIKAGKFVLFQLDNSVVIAGLLFGAFLPYLFSSLNIKSVSQVAQKIMAVVEKQRKNMTGDQSIDDKKDDYTKCVETGTRHSIVRMLLPVLISLGIPFAIWAISLLLGDNVSLRLTGSVLIGSIVSGIFMALSMVVSGSAWNNAKKYIEAGNFGGKGGPAHQASLTGDSLGDIYKDTVGPGIVALIKMLNIVALLVLALWIL